MFCCLCDWKEWFKWGTFIDGLLYRLIIWFPTLISTHTGSDLWTTSPRLVEWLTFKIHSIHEHQHNIVRNILQEAEYVTIGGVLYPLVDLLHRNQRDGP